jgi:hypothetical protein
LSPGGCTLQVTTGDRVQPHAQAEHQAPERDMWRPLRLIPVTTPVSSRLK